MNCLFTVSFYDNAEIMDTGTVRLVIFLGMFLVFVSDYSSLISTIFGNNAERNSTFKLINGQPKAESSSEKLFKDELKINFEKRNGNILKFYIY